MKFNDIVMNYNEIKDIKTKQDELFNQFTSGGKIYNDFYNIDFWITNYIKNNLDNIINSSNLDINNLINSINQYKNLIFDNIENIVLRNKVISNFNNFIKYKLSNNESIINYFRVIIFQLVNINEIFNLEYYKIENIENDINYMKFLIINNIDIYKIFKILIKDIIKIINIGCKDLDLYKINDLFELLRENIKKSLYLIMDVNYNIIFNSILDFYNGEINSILYDKFIDDFINYININDNGSFENILKIIFNNLKYESHEFENFKINLKNKINKEILKKDNSTYNIIVFFINIIECMKIKNKIFNKIIIKFLGTISKEIQNRHDSLSIIINFYLHQNNKLLNNIVNLDNDYEDNNNFSEYNNINKNNILNYFMSLFKDDHLTLEIYCQELLKKYLNQKKIDYDIEKNLINIFFDKIGLYHKSFCMQLLNQIKFCHDINIYLNEENIIKKLINNIKIHNWFFMIEEKNLLKNKIINEENNMLINQSLIYPFDKINNNFKQVKQKKKLILDKENTIIDLKLKLNNDIFRIKCNLYQANFILKFKNNIEYDYSKIHEEFNLNSNEIKFLDSIIKFWKKNKIITIENGKIKLCNKLPDYLNQENNIEFNIKMNQNYSDKLFKTLDLILKISDFYNVDKFEMYLNQVKDNKLIDELLKNKSLLHTYLKKYKNLKNNN